MNRLNCCSDVQLIGLALKRGLLKFPQIAFSSLGHFSTTQYEQRWHETERKKARKQGAKNSTKQGQHRNLSRQLKQLPGEHSIISHALFLRSTLDLTTAQLSAYRYC